jgi:hypothetical protein
VAITDITATYSGAGASTAPNQTVTAAPATSMPKPISRVVVSERLTSSFYDAYCRDHEHHDAETEADKESSGG